MDSQNNLKSNIASKKSQEKVFGVLMLEAGMEFAVLIAAPLIAGLLAGKWLDNKYHTNFYVIIGILLGIFVTSVAIYKRIKDYKEILDRKTKK